MIRREPARTTPRRSPRPTVVGLVVVCVAIVATLIHQTASTSTPTFNELLHNGHGRTRIEADGAVTRQDGLLPDGVTVFDDRYAGVKRLDPDLIRALREATMDAAHDGIEVYVNSGWRSPDYQDRLLRDAVSKYGSYAEAARWVATAGTSPHVSGDAVDVGDADATAWLSEHGAAYGLCQIYRNESWHFELRTVAIDRGWCPPMYADPTQDPRMQP